MRENNRKPIEKCRRKLPQFTTMNVIDGQAGLVIYSSLIFYSLTIDNILNIIAGIAGLRAEYFPFLLVIIGLAFIVSRFAHGMYHTILDRYFRNFTNKDIDTKIFAVKNLFSNVLSAVAGFMASFLLSKMSTAYCMIIVGIAFTIMYILIGKYMKTRVGLSPEKYSKQERKYDELKTNE